MSAGVRWAGARDHHLPPVPPHQRFLIFVGLGWLIPKRWVVFAIAGGSLGFTASGLSALLPSLGSPSVVHIGALVGSIVLEMGLIYLVLTKFKDAEYRTLVLWILLVVGLHFLTMGLAHGPLIAILGVLTTLNAALALAWNRVPLQIAGILDALLKIGFGAWMLFGYPAYTCL